MAIGENKTLQDRIDAANAEYSRQRQEHDMLQRGIAMQQAKQVAQQQALWARQIAHTGTYTIVGQGGGFGPNPTSIAHPINPTPKEWWGEKEGIKTERLFLMQLEPTSDFIDTILEPDIIDAVCNWLNDQELMRFSVNRHFTHTAENQAEYWIRTFGQKNLLKSLPSKYWFIFQCDKERRKDDVLIGTITGMAIDNRAVDIGILLGRGQGFGFAAEAMSAVINHYNMRGVTLFTCGTDRRNEAMIKLATTMGMQETISDATHLYFRMDIPSSAPKKNKQMAVNFATMSTRDQLEWMAHQKAEENENKKSLVQQMKAAFHDSSKWTGR